MADHHDYRIVNDSDNGEFLTSATLVLLTNGKEQHREVFHGSSEFPPGFTGRELAYSAGEAWLEHMNFDLDELLDPYGIEWQREQIERYEEEVPF